MNRIAFVADPEKLAQKKERLDAYASSVEGISRSRLKNGVTSIMVDGRQVKLSYKLSGGENVEIMWDDPVPENIEPQDIPLDVVFENDDVLVVNKKQGMVVHPAAGNWSGTLVNALLFRWGMSAVTADKLVRRDENEHAAECTGDRKDTSHTLSDAARPGIVHRLDKDTSGLIICGKTRAAVEELQKQFQSRHVYKEYIAIVKGKPPFPAGEIKTQIVRDPSDRKHFVAKTGTTQGKFAWTKYQCVATYGPYSLMRLCLKTGRTHQIRVHMKYINCPIVGDPIYSRKDGLFDTATLMLHSRKMAIRLPGEDTFSTFEAPVPRRFKKVMRVLRKQYGTENRTDIRGAQSADKSGTVSSVTPSTDKSGLRFKGQTQGGAK